MQLMQLRVQLVTQYAIDFFKEKKEQGSQIIGMTNTIGDGFEIHAANQLRNSVAKDLGLNLYTDTFLLGGTFFINTVTWVYSNLFNSEVKKALSFTKLMEVIVLNAMEKISDLPNEDLPIHLSNALKPELDQLGSDNTFDVGFWFYEEADGDGFKFKKVSNEAIQFRLQCTLIERLRDAGYLDNSAFSTTSAEGGYKVINVKGASLLSYAWVKSASNNSIDPPLSLESFFKENLEQSITLPLNVFLKKHLKNIDYLLLALFYAIKKENYTQAILHLKQLQEALKNSSGTHQINDPLTLHLLKHLNIKDSYTRMSNIAQNMGDFEKVNAFIGSIPELVNVARTEFFDENMDFVTSLIPFLSEDLPAYTSARLQIENALAALEEKALELEKASIDKAGSAFELICALKTKNDVFFAGTDKTKEAREKHIKAYRELVDKYMPIIDKSRSSEFDQALHRFILKVGAVLSFGILLAIPKVRQTLFTDWTETQAKAESVIATLQEELLEKSTGLSPG